MFNFEYQKPIKVIFGAGEVKRIGEEAARFGKKALLLTGSEKGVKARGYYEKVLQSCREAGIELIPCFGVKSNPTAEHAAEAIAIVKREHPDLIIALGGGSVMDEAKYIGAAVKYDGDPWDLATRKTKIEDTLPVITVVTISATSSELNGTSVMSNETLQRKEGFGSPVMLPKVSILDPELTYTVPLQRTAYSTADIISHLLEHSIGHNLPWAPFQDHFAQGSIRTIMECMDRLLADPQDREARAQMMWCAANAWSGFYDLGLGTCKSTIHILGHSLSNFYDTPHGAAMSVTILATLRYFLDTNTKKIADFAREVFGVREENDVAAAKKGIDLLEAWFKKIGTPISLKEAGITDPDAIEKMAPDAVKTAATWGQGDQYTVEICREMFKLCL